MQYYLSPECRIPISSFCRVIGCTCRSDSMSVRWCSCRQTYYDLKEPFHLFWYRGFVAASEPPPPTTLLQKRRSRGERPGRRAPLSVELFSWMER